MNIGIIGCGKIFNAYLKGSRHYEEIDLVAVADIDVERAQSVAEEHEIPWGGSVEDLLARDDIEQVVNLTIPVAHASVDRQILEAGKHAYSEKPLALDCAEIDAVMELAKTKGLRLGCAPDTFLGAGIQTARAVLDEGRIGTPVAAVAFMAGPGHESWHPAPQFYYQPGGGPLFDMGPYYITALVNLLGPVDRVCGFSGKARQERTITSEPLNGTVIPVEVDTHYSSSLHFANGALGTMLMSFDVRKHALPRIEIYGTEGTLQVPDPNGFGGQVSIGRNRKDDWEEIPLMRETGMRGAGPADLAAAVAEGRPHRANAELAYHVLEIMEKVTASGTVGSVQAIDSRCERPAAMPVTANA